MKDIIASTIKKQLIKMAIAVVVVGGGLGFRMIQVASDPEWSEAAVEESLNEAGATPEPSEAADSDDQESEGSLFSLGADAGVEPAPLSTRAMPCYVNGQKLFMVHADCVTRGGLPEMP